MFKDYFEDKPMWLKVTIVVIALLLLPVTIVLMTGYMIYMTFFDP